MGAASDRGRQRKAHSPAPALWPPRCAVSGRDFGSEPQFPLPTRGRCPAPPATLTSSLSLSLPMFDVCPIFPSAANMLMFQSSSEKSLLLSPASAADRHPVSSLPSAAPVPGAAERAAFASDTSPHSSGQGHRGEGSALRSPGPSADFDTNACSPHFAAPHPPPPPSLLLFQPEKVGVPGPSPGASSLLHPHSGPRRSRPLPRSSGDSRIHTRSAALIPRLAPPVPSPRCPLWVAR